MKRILLIVVLFLWASSMGLCQRGIDTIGKTGTLDPHRANKNTDGLVSKTYYGFFDESLTWQTFSYDDNSGTNHYDISGTTDFGQTAVNLQPTFSSDDGGALFYDGVDDRITQATLLDTVPATITLSCWVKTYTNGISHVLMAKSNVDKDDRLWLTVGVANTFGFSTEENAQVHTTISSTTTLSTNAWYHCVATWGNVAGKVIYINGILENSDPAETTLMANGAHTDFFVGTFWTGGDPTWGKIDDVRVMENDLNSNQVFRLYQEGRQ